MASRPASKWQLDCKDAFDLNEAWERGALRVDSRELLHDDFALARGEERPVRPLDFIRDEGRSPRDLIGTTYGTLVLASERLLSVLREHRFTGWTTFSVKVCLDHERELEGYDGFAVTGRCGPIDDQLSEAIVLEPPVPGGEAALVFAGSAFRRAAGTEATCSHRRIELRSSWWSASKRRSSGPT